MNNLYIIEEVLSDYIGEMTVIAAPSLERCKEIFAEKFWDWTDEFDDEFDSAIKAGGYKVIENINHAEGIVSYVVGGG